MIVERVVFFLEMTALTQLREGSGGRQVVAAPWTDTAAALRSRHDDIAAVHRWPSLAWSGAHWEQRLHDPHVRWLALLFDEQVVGIAELELQPASQVEITIFGLSPRWQSRGLGASALTSTARAAWDGAAWHSSAWHPPACGCAGLSDPQCAVAPAQPVVQRVWLHTSTRDAPHALRNYQARGFTVYATETRTEVVV